MNVTTNSDGNCLIYINPDLPMRKAGPSVYPPAPFENTSKQRWRDFWVLNASSLLANNSDLASGNLSIYNETNGGIFSGVFSGPL